MLSRKREKANRKQSFWQRLMGRCIPREMLLRLQNIPPDRHCHPIRGTRSLNHGSIDDVVEVEVNGRSFRVRIVSANVLASGRSQSLRL